ncbi:winged helix-turn-helix transcriptional regulator [Dictyobacter formicarum]|uniref:MarR family transcriptional regulator n=1 Tax=Dictyobacter formicarum TaxID=2778368 RepID=A0ABQ3VEA4_9CHLR|nr:helix-turn-helix domain-containing protein [Dictyobacter formicarum]GHO84069.1 MarR family transcriptional regulator [Dictyobacter formicarum]
MRDPIYTRNYHCLMEATADVIGGKWKTLILYYLLETPRRFNELKRLLPDVSQRILTQQLRELEHDGIIHREIYKEIPPRVEYSLTDVGTSLKQIILLMLAWGEQYMEQFEGTRPWCAGLEQSSGIEQMEEEKEVQW